MPSSVESTLTAENLLEEDPFYSEVLPSILGQNFSPSGEYKSAFFSNPESLHPFSNDPFVVSLWELCTGSLSQLKVGHFQSMAPHLAIKMTEEINSNEICYHVTLQDNLYWTETDLPTGSRLKIHPRLLEKHPVTSKDFKLYVDMILNRYFDLPKAIALRSCYKDLLGIEIIDDQNFKVLWKVDQKPSFKAKFLTGQLRPIPAHIFECDASGGSVLSKECDHQSYLFAKHFSNHWAQNFIFSCGPWQLQSKDHDQITLVRNAEFQHANAALLDKMTFIYKSSPISAWQAFKNHELTSCYLSPLQLKDLNLYLEKDEAKDVEVLEYLSKIYYFIGWNHKSPLFENSKVRQALSLAVNTEQIIDHFLKGKAVPLSGPFTPGSNAYDSELELPSYDPKLAVKLLEEEGWQLNQAHGVRKKTEGSRDLALRFHLAYFVSNEMAQSICQYIASSLKIIGVDCQLQGLDYHEFMNRYQNKNFDALYMGWALSNPPENPRPCWHSEGSDQRGSSNIVGFSNPAVDQWIEALDHCQDLDERKKLFHQIHETIAHLYPYTFLYAPKHLFVYRSQLKNVWLPTKRPDLITQATVDEICPKVFYMDHKEIQ